MVLRSWRSLAAFGGITACALAASIPRASAQSFLVEPAPAAAEAGDPNSVVGGTDADYQQLLQRLQAAETRIEQLEGSPYSTTAYAPAAPEPADAKPAKPTEDERLAKLEKAAEEAAKKPAFPAVKLSGFFHLDAGDFNQDAANAANLGDIQNGVGFRRARMAAIGQIGEFTGYYCEMDFGIAGRPSFTDVWGEQQQLPVFGNVRMGQFRQPTTMDGLSSIRQLQFLERSLPFQALDPFRKVGAMSYDKNEDEMWSWAYGVYRSGGFNNAPLGDTRFATDIGDNGGASVVGRMTHLLYYDEGSSGRYLLSTGGFYTFSRLTGSSANAPFYESRAIPEFFVGDPASTLTSTGTPFFVDTGRLFANQYDFYGGQLAGQYGPLNFQSEFMATQVNQVGNATCNYEGAYVQGGYFLTGENRTYNRMFGVFDTVTPYEDFFGVGRGRGGICGWGAWEVCSRWSYIDLRDANAVPAAGVLSPPPVPNAGRLDNLTCGVNWYWNQYAKLQFDYIHCFLDNVAGNSDCDIMCGRFQCQF
jgi:phosphate-selective porin OprO/OprP